jgi:hypothetical protein
LTCFLSFDKVYASCNYFIFKIDDDFSAINLINHRKMILSYSSFLKYSIRGLLAITMEGERVRWSQEGKRETRLKKSNAFFGEIFILVKKARVLSKRDLFCERL